MSIVLALGAAFAYGSADFAGGLASRRISPVVAAFGAQLVGLVVLFAALPLLGATNVATSDLVFGAIAGLFGGAGVVVLFRALARGPMSIVAPTTALSASLVPIAIGIAMGERPGAITFVGMAISLVAVVLITREQPSGGESPMAAASRSVILTALAGGTIFGLFFVFLHQSSDAAGVWPLLAARATSVPLLAILLIRSGEPMALPGSAVLPAILVSGVLDMAANIMYLLALHHGMLAVVAALAGLYPASTVLLAQSHLQERLARPQMAGLGVAAFAAILMAV